MRPQIWSLKKSEDQAAKSRPKTSAALIRVQKGESLSLQSTRDRAMRDPPRFGLSPADSPAHDPVQT